MELSKEIPSPYDADMYQARLIVMLESGPQTGVFRQIMLTARQFELIEEALRSHMKPAPNHSFLVPVSIVKQAEIVVPIENHYTAEEIEKELKTFPLA